MSHSVNTAKRILAIILALVISLGAAVPEVFAAGNDYTYDTDYAGFLGEGLIHDERFDGYKIHYGLDVSRYQGSINWQKVADAGAEFVFVRVGYRGYSSGSLVEDSKAQYNITEALKYGLKVGVYFYSQAITVSEGIEEADYVMSLLEGYGIGPEDLELPVVFDVEYPSNSSGSYTGRLYNAGLSKSVRTDITLAFLERVESMGYTGCLYGSRSALNGEIKCDMSKINGKYLVWLAAYTKSKKAGYGGPYSFWQYSCKGKVPGINAEVDVDVWYEEPGADIRITKTVNNGTGEGITVSWTKGSYYSRFKLQRKAGSGSWQTVSDKITDHSYVDKGAEKGGTKYTYRVAGYHEGEWGDYSETAELTRNPFADVKTSDSYFKALMWAYNNGIVGGTSSTTFSPKDNCTRGQFALMLWRMNGKPSTKDLSNPFKDVRSTSGFYNGIVWCYSQGITSGTSAKTYSPGDNITRWQILLMLWKMAGKPSPSTTEDPFTNVRTTASYYKAALWAYEKGITADAGFDPNEYCTRWQLVLFLYRTNNVLGLI